MALNSRADDSRDWQLGMNTVLERNCYMFNNPLMSDIKFTCGESRREFYGHKYVLATSSPVYYAMFYSDIAEKNSVITLTDTDEDSFEEFLRFLYTDECALTAESVVKLLYLARKYMIHSLTAKCTAFIQNDAERGKMFTILEQLLQFNDKELEEKCWRIIDSQTNKAVTSDAFNNIDHVTLLSLLKRATLNIEEIELFRAVIKWSEVQCSKNGLELTNQNKRLVLGDAMYELYFLAMSQTDFVQYVSLPGLLTAEEANRVFHQFNGFSVPPSRWKLSCKTRREQLIVRCCRFPAEKSTITLDNFCNSDKCRRHLRFQVNKPITLHGVCLFGDTNCSKYEVSLKVYDVNFNEVVLSDTLAEVQGIYTSKYIARGIYGFDVFLPTQLTVVENKFVGIAANIKGPKSCSGHQERSRVVMDGLEVTFDDYNYFGNKVSSKGSGSQFYQILISKI